MGPGPPGPNGARPALAAYDGCSHRDRYTSAVTTQPFHHERYSTAVTARTVHHKRCSSNAARRPLPRGHVPLCAYRHISSLIASHLVAHHCSCLISSHLVTSRHISSHLVISRHISSHLVTSRPISRHISSHLITSRHISSHLVTPRHISLHLFFHHCSPPFWPQVAFVVDCSPILRRGLSVLATNYSPVQPCRVFHGATSLADALEWSGAPNETAALDPAMTKRAAAIIRDGAQTSNRGDRGSRAPPAPAPKSGPKGDVGSRHPTLSFMREAHRAKEVASVRRDLRRLPDIPMEWYEMNGF